MRSPGRGRRFAKLDARRQLALRREEIERRLRALRRDLARWEPSVEEEDEVGRAGSALDVDLAVAAGQLVVLRRIDSAIRSLDKRRYGTCVDCGRPIAAERLRALPFAERCRACQAACEAAGEPAAAAAP
jgi:DnaK suppressor protein